MRLLDWTTVRGFCLCLSCSSAPPQEVATESRSGPPCDPDNGGLKLADGFCAVVVADGLQNPRHIDVAPNGDVYVHNRGNRGRAENEPGGGVVVLRDDDDDGRADIIERFSDHYGTGLQLRGDYLYLSTTTAIYRYARAPGELLPSGEAELVVLQL